MTGPTGSRRPLRVVIVDDEPLARRALVRAVDADPELELAGECPDGETAIETVGRIHPEILLLDVQMPETNGFGVLERLDFEVPVVVFVTAYDEYAVSAFEQRALDYVLKPFSEDRLQQALERAKRRVRGASLAALGRNLLELAGGAAAAPAAPERLAVSKGDRTILLDPQDIDWLEAADYYVRVHAGDDSYLVRKPLKWFEETLDPTRFVRVHRSAMVQVSRILEIRRLGPDDHVAVLSGGREIAISRSGREALDRLVR